MNESNVKATIAGLIDKVQHLQTENDHLRLKSTVCAEAMRKLVTRVEHLQAQVQDDRPTAPSGTDYRARPPVVHGRTVAVNVGCGPLYITLNEDETGKPFEVFFKLGKSGEDMEGQFSARCRGGRAFPSAGDHPVLVRQQHLDLRPAALRVRQDREGRRREETRGARAPSGERVAAGRGADPREEGSRQEHDGRS